MAIRQEELYPAQQAVLYRFPPQRAALVRARRRRMEARRRRAGLAGVLLVLVCAFLLATGPSGSAPAASRSDAPRAVTVRSGDTLWGLAERYAPEGIDLRAYVDLLEDTNDLTGGLAAGMRIRLPK